MGNQQSAPSAAAAPAVCPAVEERNQQSRCPVPEGYRNPAIYNVYGQRVNDPSAQTSANPLAVLKNTDLLDPKNNMPLEPNQQPCPGQRRPLSTQRIQSTIPKGGTDSAWVYPSPQMFFNALRRKGKGDDVKEEDMEAVVRAHNTMNEVTWNHVANWEQLHCQECAHSTLLHFQGRPDDLSPLARLRSWLGGPLPFDRHDWVVDRCGKEVRYVIDFYFFDDKAGTPEAFEIVTRPALDSVESALDRLKMGIYVNFARWGLPCPITGAPASVGQGALEAQQQQAAAAAAAAAQQQAAAAS